MKKDQLTSPCFDKAKVLVRRQLVGGAKFALATAKTHYPRMDYSLIARGPKAAPGRQRVSMTGRYEAAGPAALADRKSTRLNSSHITRSRMPSSA